MKHTPGPWLVEKSPFMLDIVASNKKSPRRIMKNRAFKHYLASLQPSEAAHYIFECMRSGPSPNMAWELAEEVYGEEKWLISQEFFVKLLNFIYAEIEAEKENENGMA